MPAPPRILEFDGFRLDLDGLTLSRAGTPIALTPKAFDTLAVLVGRAGEVVGKDELLAAVWPETFVEEATLTQNVYTLRKALAEAGGQHTYIETVPRRGYRFVAPLRAVETDVATRPFALPSPSELAAPPAEVAPPTASRPASRRPPRPWRLAALATVLLAAVGLSLWLGRQPAPSPDSAGASVRRLAVLPFEPLSADAEDGVLGLGLADALITRLSNLHQLVVRPTSAVRRYTGGERDPAAIGRDLKVDSVLAGTLQRAGDALRVSVQLIDVESGAATWAATFDDRGPGLFDLQDSLSERLAGELRLQLTWQERARLTRRATADPAAYQAYVRGRYFWNRRTEEGILKAVESFQQAIALDPGFALAHAGLADCYVLLPLFGSVPPRWAFPRATAAAEHALALDDQLAEAHTALAYTRFIFDWDFAAAETGFKQAIALNPGYPTAHQWYGFLLAAVGRHDEALTEARRALELDPTSLVINADYGMVLSFAGRGEAAVAQFERTLELDASFPYAHFGLGQAFLAAGEPAAAVDELGRAASLAPTSPTMRAAHGYALGAAGREAEARRVLADLEALARRQFVESSNLAFVAMGLGEKRQALAWLTQACEERSRFVVFFRSWRFYDPLRGEPGWPELVAKVGLPE